MVVVNFKGKEYKFRYTKQELLDLDNNGGTIFLKNLLKEDSQNLISIAFGSIILGAYVPASGKKNYISTIQFQNTACYRHLWKTLALDNELSDKFMSYVTSPRSKFVLNLTESKKK